MNQDTQVREKQFTWSNGELFYRHWTPQRNDSKRAVFLFHRGHEHSGRMFETVEELGLDDTHIIAWDARGHGQSPGKRGFTPDGFNSLVTDMDAFVRGVCNELGIDLAQTIIIAHSVAAVVASTWIHDYNPGIRAAVLATPAFSVRLYVPFALPMLGLVNKFKPDAKISSYVKGKLLTHDPEQAKAYDADDMISKDISNRVLIEMAAAAKRVVADAHTIKTPILMLQANADWVVDNSVQDLFFKNLGSNCKQRHDIPNSFHAVFQETSRKHTVAVIKQFLTERWQVPQLSIDEQLTPNNTRSAEQLKKPLPIYHPKWWFYNLQKLSMHFPGSLSKGINIGWRYGFDSGSALDHVYTNQHDGTSPLGKIIDKVYLNAPGWEGIRQRKIHLEQALTECARYYTDKDQVAQIVDIASGPGRYIIDFIKSYDAAASAICRDKDPQGIKEGQDIAEQEHMEHVTYEIGDAFNTDELAALNGRANIIIASGVYELFDDNTFINQSIAGIHQALPDDGFFIYTNQTWHPQLEFIARVLINRDKEPWVMRCRAQVEIDAMVSEQGFSKVRTFSDRWGIFTVSIARKNA